MSHREDQIDRFAALEARIARQHRLAWAALTLGVAIGWSLSGAPRLLAQGPRPAGEILTVRGLVVVDDKGVERVRIGAPLPDPVGNGRRVPRQGVVSGMLIFDAEGTNGVAM